ncbi:PAS domain S-box protein [Mucilaginibacter sp. HMF5004]|uniref:PAS domain-containing sensor histidine kinase n=1 Tax=Mucilaginibacter rivuli TaxID=2857527 RepID=UPI001C5D6D39|nr:PAS domain-containing sensor histidine kinase [Mucilaginibacter rivuli]MBW4891741.1 PAS domain S-box protein [Mucilaginibacter rivuli]
METKQKNIDSDARFRKLIENSFSGITLLNRDLDIIYRSPSAERINGWNMAERVKNTTKDLTHPDDREQLILLLNEVLDSPGLSKTGCFRSLHFSGHYIWLECVYTNMFNEPEINAIVCNFIDVTERKLAEIEVQKKTSQVQYLLESITDGFASLDENLCYTYVNTAIENMVGMKSENLIGRNIWEIFPDAVGSATYHAIQKAFTEKIYVSNEDHYEPLNLWQENRIYPSGNGISLFIRNITSQKNQELQRELLSLAVTQSLKEKNNILESIGDAFFAVDENWIVTYWNNMAEKVLQTPKSNIINKMLWDVFKDAIGSVSYNNYHEAIATNQAVHFEDHYERLNKWYEVSAYPSGKGLSVYFKDITERKVSEILLKELNNDLKKQTKELATSNAELEQFAYVASHDLQEPLRMITGFLSQIERRYSDKLDSKGRQYIHFAVDGAKRMREIILDLLEFSRVGRVEDSIEPTDTNKLLNDIISLYHKKIADKKAVIQYDNLPTINTYKVPLRQVFQNLVSNALKYQQAGNVPVIKINYTQTSKYYTFSVQDNGIGIDAEYFDTIFIIFQRLHNKEIYSGTGMGLAVTKKIVENLGGKIWLESEPGKGSTFYFNILKK